MATNQYEIVKRVNEEFPHLLKYNSLEACGEFLQRVCAQPEMKNERWGLLSKNEGEAGITYPNGVRCSQDVVALSNGERIDIINGANGHPAPGGPCWNVIAPEHWRPHNVYVDCSSWPIYDSGVPSGITSSPAILSRGWFCLLRGLKDWEIEVSENWGWLLENENPDVFRIMLNVEGMMHCGSIGIDPWRDAGVDPNSDYWDLSFRKTLDLLEQNGKLGWFTLHGGNYYLPNESDRIGFNDQVLNAISSHGSWDSVLGFEIANEYNVNGFSDHDVQVLAEDMRRKLDSIGHGNKWLALSSPALAHGATHDTTNEEMLESMERLYGKDSYHYGASHMTIHRSRDISNKWADPFAYNTLMPELPKIDNEPAGQGASAGGDINEVEWLINEYKNVSDAGWKMYVGHNAWCVWNGHMPEEHLAGLDEEHSKHYIKDITNQPEVSEGLKTYRETGEIEIPDGGREEMIPYDESKSVEFGAECNQIYEEAKIAKDPGMVSVHSQRCAWDFYVGKMDWDECFTKHINEFRAEYGLVPL